MSGTEKEAISEIMKSLELPELTFENEKHIYKYNGFVIPSVSTLMEPLKNALYKNVSECTLNVAAEKGSTVHNAIENWIKFGIEDIPTEYSGYFDGFKEWWEENDPQVVGSEIRVYHKLLLYGGTIDLLSYINGELTLTDFKTTYAVSDMNCKVQLEAYAQALASHGVKVQRKQILHLPKDGRKKVHEYAVNDSECWNVFRSLKVVNDYISRTK